MKYISLLLISLALYILIPTSLATCMVFNEAVLSVSHETKLKPLPYLNACIFTQ